MPYSLSHLVLSDLWSQIKNVLGCYLFESCMSEALSNLRLWTGLIKSRLKRGLASIVVISTIQGMIREREVETILVSKGQFIGNDSERRLTGKNGLFELEITST